MRNDSPPPSGALPTHFWIPDGARFDAADEAADLARALGDQVDEPEIAALRVLLAEDGKGRRIALESGLFCGRQNVKTWAGQRMVLYRAWIHNLKRIVWTAHLYKTTQDTFFELLALIESHSWLEQQVLKVSRGNGEEGIHLRNGCQIDFVARSQKSARGWAADEVVGDEGLYLTPAMIGAVFPTLSSRPDPHFTHLSSPGLPTSEVIRRVRDRGRAGGDPSLSYAEWTSERSDCVSSVCRHEPGTPGCQLDDLDKVRQANPAHPRRIGLDYILSERRAMPVAEYMRERLGWWEEPPEATEGENFPLESWAERLDASSELPEGTPLAFAIDTSWDRKTTWISLAGEKSDGKIHPEVVVGGPGTDWVVPWFTERRKKYPIAAIGLQANGAPVSSLFEQLRDEMGDLVKGLSVQELGRACGSFYDLITSGSLVHTGQEQLDDAVRLAAIRPIGDAWVIDRKASPVDVAPLVSAIEAAYLIQTTTYTPPRKRAAPRRIR